MDLQYPTLYTNFAEEHVRLISEKQSTSDTCKKTERDFCVLCCVVLSWLGRDLTTGRSPTRPIKLNVQRLHPYFIMNSESDQSRRLIRDK
jgi:hypothetical protein